MISGPQIFIATAYDSAVHIKQPDLNNNNNDNVNQDSPEQSSNKQNKQLLQHEETHIKVGEFVKSAVYGGLDGVITTFMIALSGYGGGTSIRVIVAIGVSSLIADALSMAIADYVATKSDAEYMEMEKKREQNEIENDFEAEKREMVNIYKELGIEDQDSREIVDILAKKPEGFLKVMLVEELGIITDEETPFINCIVTFFSFALFGLMPLLPLIVARGSNLPWKDIYILVSGALTFFFLLVLGFSKSIITMTKWYWSCLETVSIGAVSAAAAYGIGKALGQ